MVFIELSVDIIEWFVEELDLAIEIDEVLGLDGVAGDGRFVRVAQLGGGLADEFEDYVFFEALFLYAHLLYFLVEV